MGKRMTSARGFFAQARAIAREGEEAPDRLWQSFVTLADRARDTSFTEDADGALSSMKLLHVYGQRHKELVSTSVAIYRSRCIDIREIADSGHFPFFDNPDEFWSMLESWLLQNQLLPQGPGHSRM